VVARKPHLITEFGPDVAGAKAAFSGRGRPWPGDRKRYRLSLPRRAAQRLCAGMNKQLNAERPTLEFRAATGRRKLDDYDIFDGHRDVGRIYFIETYQGRGNWFWGLSFQATGRKSFGHAASLNEAKAAFAVEYAAA
jgi:hypothetical protein